MTDTEHKKADITDFPRSRSIQLVKWQRYGGIPRSRVFRNRTLAIRKAQRLEALGLAVQVYSADLGPWERVSVPEHAYFPETKGKADVQPAA